MILYCATDIKRSNKGDQMMQHELGIVLTQIKRDVLIMNHCQVNYPFLYKEPPSRSSSWRSSS